MSARLDLTGLTTASPRVWGGVRLVPLLRAEPITGLRLHARLYGDGAGVVSVDRGTEYWSYIPHGFVATWSGDGTPAAAYGTSLRKGGRREDAPDRVPLRLHQRMARRENRNQLRFLPLHLAVEGYLALHFGGPSVVWDEWSQRAIRNGLSPREEQAYSGAEVRDLADALRVFEIHPGQCGVVVHVGDTLAGAFVVPHPDDYRALHDTLVRDMYGELIHHSARYAAPVPEFTARLDGTYVRSLADLRAAARRQQADWSRFHDDTMAAGLFDNSYSMSRVYRMGEYTLSRFLPAFAPKHENHIGELITDHRGRTAYLKTFRLSEVQVRRGHLLTRLADHDWHLPSTAEALGTGEAELGMRLNSSGLGFLLRGDVLARYRAAVSQRRR